MTSQRHTTIKHVQTLLFLPLPFGCPSRTCCISYLWLPNGITANLAASDTFTNSVSGFVGLGTAWLGPLQGCQVLADRAPLRINRGRVCSPAQVALAVSGSLQIASVSCWLSAEADFPTSTQ